MEPIPSAFTLVDERAAELQHQHKRVLRERNRVASRLTHQNEDYQQRLNARVPKEASTSATTISAKFVVQILLFSI